MVAVDGGDDRHRARRLTLLIDAFDTPAQRLDTDPAGIVHIEQPVAFGALFTTEAEDESNEEDEWEPFPEPEYEVDETTGEILN